MQATRLWRFPCGVTPPWPLSNLARFRARIDQRISCECDLTHSPLIQKPPETVDAMLQSDPVFAIIARTEPFSELTTPHAQSLAGLCRMRRYRKGEVIFLMGEAGDALYGIKTGRVRTSIVSAEGKEMTLNLFGPKSTFGVVGFLDGGPRMATATVVEPAEIFRLPRNAFLAFIEANPEV